MLLIKTCQLIKTTTNNTCYKVMLPRLKNKNKNKKHKVVQIGTDNQTLEVLPETLIQIILPD